MNTDEISISDVDGDNGYPRPSPQMMYATKDFLSRLYEELGPYQPRSQLRLPEWVQQMLGRRVLSVEKYMEERDIGQRSDFAASSKGERRTSTSPSDSLPLKDFYFKWKATLPATQTTCLALTVLPSARGKCSTMPSLPIHLEESLVFDWFWMKLCLMLVGLRLLQVRMVNSRLLRILFSAVYGSFILIILCFIYFLREFQALSVGRIGVVVILGMGGVAALAEVLLSALGYVLTNPNVLGVGIHSFLPLAFQELLAGLPGGVAWGIAALFAGTLSSLLMHLFFSDRLLYAGTQWGMHGLVILNFLLLVAQNREATFLVLSLWYGGPYIYTLWHYLTNALENLRESRLNAPEDYLPPFVHREVTFARPMTIESGRYISWREAIQRRNIIRAQQVADLSYNVQGNNRVRLADYDEKTSLYEKEGAAHTRRALEELAMQIRASPGKYTQRLLDPNTVHRWAGVRTSDSENDKDTYGNQ
ncbi:unnamed protein product [Phytomonas sp. Hart1]|nr:unnamed protein product [Phytomonas sp. Hart1]|eukprot:CCW69747.1 unnamed protein product [Phytomonas sp. isolate Hart1]